MKVAFCFYGQPRLLEEGYASFQALFNNNANVEFDFFYHTWFRDTGDETHYFEGAPWRNTPKEQLRIKKDSLQRIQELYKPKAGFHEEPRQFCHSIVHPSISYSLCTSLLMQTIYLVKASSLRVKDSR
jgi:hypothetical protein